MIDLAKNELALLVDILDDAVDSATHGKKDMDDPEELRDQQEHIEAVNALLTKVKKALNAQRDV